MNIITKKFLKSNIIRFTHRNFTCSKSTDYSEGYSTRSQKELKKPKKGFQRPPPMYGFKREVVPSDLSSKPVNNKPLTMYGFKREVVPSDFKPKKNFYDCENEKWFPDQLNSGETWKDKIVHEDGHGKNMFHPKYGNSFWDPHNYN